ncbi:hypothetical protein PR202_ga05273 [Eleusine coracana subsp. coracana]|uniref:Pectinesterase inhibitor domain-containing protein n=1 Tax=Eleusine coracana subsp. coracana TaxID=191504 RepID=A0AAV5BRZ6_ELECO|nr:hypothetical protein QOZ80_5AG0371510 [Eleusine coracana subsp. coracana]GJM88721.1 hypothetical protein PR202_ga04819 [Eleusine coracana subsp. coracana]GJM89123.1 hypothetical protein PR202_ga05273 [Eleusine coracana subsp. coracana]
MQPVAVLLLAIAIAPALAGGTSTIINETCAKLPNYYLPRSYCTSVLSNDATAVAAPDVRALAVAAINITAHKAASTLSAISYLMDDLSDCRRYYSEMVESLAGVLNDYRAGRFHQGGEGYGGQGLCNPFDGL